MANEKGNDLSTYVDYKVKEVPKNVTLKEGRTYKICNGFGIKEAVVEGIRQLGDEIVVYYKVDNAESSFGSSKWQHTSANLNTFKMQMMDFGKVDELEIFHPGKIN